MSTEVPTKLFLLRVEVNDLLDALCRRAATKEKLSNVTASRVRELGLAWLNVKMGMPEGECNIETFTESECKLAIMLCKELSDKEKMQSIAIHRKRKLRVAD